MEVFTGHSSAVGEEAVDEATRAVPRDRDPDLVLAFWSVSQDHDGALISHALAARFPRSIVTGCTGAGGYFGGEGEVRRVEGLVVAALYTPRIRWGIERIELDGFDGRAARACVDRLLASVHLDRDSIDPKRQLCITLSDGLLQKEEALAAVLAAALDGVPSVGGSAADDLSFRETFVLHNGERHRGIAVALFAHCEDGFSLIKHQSVRSTGKLLAVTAAKGRTVFTFDGRSAAEVYAEAVGRPLSELRALTAFHPLLFRCDGRDYIRSVRSIGDDGSVHFYCAIEEGVVLALGETHEPVEALSSLMDGEHTGAFLLAFNCAHRAIEASAAGIHEQLAARLRTAGRSVIGFDTYGEQFGGLHINQTLVGAIFYDAAAPKALAPEVLSDTKPTGSSRPPGGGAATQTVDVLKAKVWELYGGGSSAIGRELEAARGREEENRRRRAVAEVRAVELERYNQGLEAEVARRIAATRAIVDNVSFGFLIVGSDLLVQSECTKSCFRLFALAKNSAPSPASPTDATDRVEGAFLPALLRLPKGQELEFSLGIEQIFDDLLPEDVALQQLRRTFPIDDRIIQAEGRVLRGASGLVESILFTISDVTDLERAKRDNARHRTLVSVLRQRDAFLLFLGETREQLAAARDSDHEVQLHRRRIVHTIKGNCASYGIDSVIDVIHEIEDALTISDDDIDAIEAEIRRFLELNHSVLGIEYSQDQEEFFEISAERMDQLRAAIAEAPAAAAAFRQWRARLRQKPAAHLLGPLPQVAERLAQRLGKLVQFRILGEQTYVDSELKTIFQSVAHLVRNAIDHGIERPEDRGAKDPRGRVEVHVEELADSLRIVVVDDGAGIDFAELRARSGASSTAVSDGELLFVDGLSTVSQATRTSGRGVGMSAVRAALQAVGGSISVESSRGLGTTIALLLPRRTGT
jgi:two-component system chemotaxis sensor kinase CheA